MSDARIYMLNALWLKPDGGAERYADYMRAVAPVVAKYGGRKVDSYVPERALIGEFDADLVFFVEWPNQEAFMSFIADPDFASARAIRDEALSKSLLVQCRASS